jgi:hypothetical protein
MNTLFGVYSNVYSTAMMQSANTFANPEAPVSVKKVSKIARLFGRS